MSTESPETPLTLSARQVLASPAVSAFLVSQFIITVGVMVQAATLGKHVFDITGNEVDIGWLGLAEFLPAAALVLVTGIIADHFNRKYVAIIGLTGEMLCSVALVLYARSDPTSTTPMFIIAVFFGASIGEDWKELLLILLGAFVGNLNKVVDYWFNSEDRDKMLIQKVDEEDGVSLSNTTNP